MYSQPYGMILDHSLHCGVHCRKFHCTMYELQRSSTFACSVEMWIIYLLTLSLKIFCADQINDDLVDRPTSSFEAPKLGEPNPTSKVPLGF